MTDVSEATPDQALMEDTRNNIVKGPSADGRGGWSREIQRLHAYQWRT